MIWSKKFPEFYLYECENVLILYNVSIFNAIFVAIVF